MKTLKFSHDGSTVGVKVPDRADFALALDRAFTALDLEYNELWDVLDEGGNAVELSTKVRLFRDGTKFAIKAPPPESAEDDTKPLRCRRAILPPARRIASPRPSPAPTVPVFEPAKAPTVLGAAKVAGAAQEVGLLAIAPPPPVMMPPMSITPSQAMVQPTPPNVATPPAPPPPPDESAKVAEVMPEEAVTVSLGPPMVLVPGQPWPVHGRMRIGQLSGELKKVG